MKVILSLTILIATFISSTLSQRYIVASTDQQLASALNNRAYTATIVNYMTTTCSRSKYMKPFFEGFSNQYTNFLFVEVLLDKYNPCYTCSPGLFENGGGIALPTMIVYKNGAKVERVSPVGSKSDLEALISRNGGYFYFHFLNI